MANRINNVLVTTFCLCTAVSFGQKYQQEFVTADIINFFNAYDKVIEVSDSVEQANLLNVLYLNKASDGLKDLIRIKEYREAEFLSYINNSPRFWKSMRHNILNVSSTFKDIDSDILKLKKLYPDLKPATIYFTVGGFRSNGTILGKNVLISSETALADESAVVDELPDWRQPYFRGNNPKAGISLLCTHEYVHTQQKELVHNLLSKCLYEGVAEFISCKATGKKSTAPAIDFGKANEKMVVDQFVKDLYIYNDSDWLWGENSNDLKVRDLGYYIGYEICERYYNMALDKAKAVKELIELDYHDESEVERIVDATKFLPKPLAQIYADYEIQRPTATLVNNFENGSKNVKPGLMKITIAFSEPLNGHNTGIDFGPLGENHFPKISNRVWSEDGKAWTIEAELQPKTHYQILISNNFRKHDGVRLKPYLIDFQTSE